MIGYEYFSDQNVIWRNNQNTIMPIGSLLNFPVDEKTCHRMLLEKKSYLIRWESEFDTFNEGSWWHVIKSDVENLEDYSKKVRYEIRRAAKKYTVLKVCRSTIIEHGFLVYKSSYERYDTHEPMYSEGLFKKQVCLLPENTEFFGVYDNDTLVGFSENFVDNGTCFYVSMWVTPDSMKCSASYLLFHEMNKYYLNELKFHYVSDGARSLSHNTNIHKFLISKFKFRKAFCKLNVIYDWKVGLMLKITRPFERFILNSGSNLLHPLKVLIKLDLIKRGDDV
ncbi:conserved hypothetical protein [Vibrio chagasii]|nr:conserved hypothetical protein [Vibrio chagasii]CAH6797737.1 conserved hypothetical protein [Vibrio chagasii]CAH7178621.1 conserved hypothetical protein [Vibrio chagasii]